MDWQPMETAPKDETRILICTDDDDVLSLKWGVYWPSHNAPQGTEQLGWVMWDGQVNCDINSGEAVAWMPVPSLPTPTDKEE